MIRGYRRSSNIPIIDDDFTLNKEENSKTIKSFTNNDPIKIANSPVRAISLDNVLTFTIAHKPTEEEQNILINKGYELVKITDGYYTYSRKPPINDNYCEIPFLFNFYKKRE